MKNKKFKFGHSGFNFLIGALETFKMEHCIHTKNIKDYPNRQSSAHSSKLVMKLDIVIKELNLFIKNCEKKLKI